MQKVTDFNLNQFGQIYQVYTNILNCMQSLRKILPVVVAMQCMHA